MKNYQEQNIQTFEDMYAQGWGNNWPSEFMISGYYNYIKSFIDFSEGEKPKVLEFACGTGANLRFFDEIGFEVYGIDSSKSAIERCIQRGFKEENFSPVNILQGIEISDIWPDTKFDLIIFLSATAYFDDNDLNILNKGFYNALKNRGVLYANFYTTIREWPVKKAENGLYVAGHTGSVDEITYLNLVENRSDVEKYYENLYKKIAIKSTLTEGSSGFNETLHYFGYKI